MRAAAWLCVGVALACGPTTTRRVRPQLVPPVETQDFGAVPVLNEKVLELPLLNLGRAPLLVHDVRLVEGGTPFELREWPTEIGSGETYPVVVAFRPPAEQAYQVTLVIETDDEANPQVQVTLLGSGSTRAVMEVEPSSIDFGRVPECGAAVRTLTIRSKGTADLIVEELNFVDGSHPGFTFVGSTRTPAVVKAVGQNGLPGQIQLTVKFTVPAQGSGGQGQIRVRGTDPDSTEVVVPLTAQVNRAPVPDIKPLGNGALGMLVTLDGSGSADPDNDGALAYKWTLRQRPMAANTQLADSEQPVASMRLDPILPGLYEVELAVTDGTGVKSCQPARASVVASPAQKLLVEMFWNHPRTDMDLHLLRTAQATVGSPPDDCFFGNPKPDWGIATDKSDDPDFLRDALTGYGPEVIGYVNPVDSSYRIVVEHAHDHLDPSPATEVTVRVYLYGVVKAEVKRTLAKRGDVWVVADVQWPSGQVTPVQ